MQPSQSIEFYLRFLNEQLNAVHEAVEALLVVLPSNEQPKKTKAAQTAASATEALLKGLSKEDRPGWAVTLLQSLRHYPQAADRQGSGHKLLKSIIAVYPAMKEHSWSISPDDPSIDFEAIYERFVAESRVPELFDELIAKLSDLVESGNIDSVRVIKALEQVIATLRRNSRGSYFSTRGAWEFASAAFRNFLWEALSEVPGAGAAVRAIRATVEELDNEMSTVKSDVSEEVIRLASPDVLMLGQAHRTPLPQLPGNSEEGAEDGVGVVNEVGGEA